MWLLNHAERQSFLELLLAFLPKHEDYVQNQEYKGAIVG